ncbi:adenylate/guanylate cyclase domain-containing protein [Mesorhizobium delmotii]|uniref:Putative integral membrane protein n=1 Tax=Mesorhizobium delmotii TaxID=1631247 RepID=A0A2P9AGW1_9HYPH|nr:adenylate/guanylate cyclase domain-containing protein [Mesorhizobium delmotii]SJM30357.1 putative integral membrane protein [Mesorhizobium delmotii]
MTETRKIAAILVADVVGYSRLAGVDEDRILARLRTLRSDLIDPTIAVHNGRMVKRTGDGSLVEFRSVVDAVRCAIEVQNGMVERNAGLPPERRIEFRIGIHLGDVVEEGDGDLMGDGVNIAARLEGIAKPGAICLSEDAYRQVRARLDLPATDLGATQLKNIAEPIRVYSLQVGVLAQVKPPIPAESHTEEPSALSPVPDKPSIAVLAFNNMSSDRELEFFADGITEEIITALSRIPNLFVVARNSTFAYKGRAVSVTRAAEELRVKYMLEGSVRAASDRVRVTAQLVEGASGRHLWAERYDGELGDIFRVQDDITRNIALALQVKLTVGELARLWEGKTTSLSAWAKFVEGRKYLDEMDRTNVLAARRLFEEAIAIDPDYGGALTLLGITHWWEARYVLEVPMEIALGRAEDVVRRLENLGDRESGVHYLRGYVAFIRNEHDTAISEMEQAMALSPSDTWVLGCLGQVCIFAGQAHKGIEALTEAMRLSPYHIDWQPYNLALGYAWVGENESEAIRLAEEYVRRLPTDPYGYTNLAIVRAFFGHESQAAAAIATLRRRNPGFGVKNLRRSERYMRADDLERVINVLRAAGLRE